MTFENIDKNKRPIVVLESTVYPGVTREVWGPILEKKKPIGIVSIGDVVKRLLEKFQHENQLLREYVSG